MRRLFRYAPDAQARLIAAMLFSVLAGACLLFEAVLLARIVNLAFFRHEALPPLLPLFGGLLGWIALRALLQAVADTVAAGASIRLKSGLRSALLRHASGLGPRFADGERRGEWLSVATEGVEQLDAYVAKYMPQAAMSVFLPGAIVCIVFGLDRVSAAVIAITLPLLILFMILVGMTAKRKADRQFKTMSRLGGHLYEVLRGLSTLRLFNRVKAQRETIAAMGEQYRVATMAALRLAFLSAFVMELFATLGTAIVAVFLGLRLISGDLSFYRAFCVLLLVPEFYAPIRALGTQYHAGMNGATAASRIMELLKLEPEALETAPGGAKLPAAGGGVAIEFDRVTVRAADGERAALDDVSFRVEAGERVALVGRSGAGKSTVLDLLQGFVRPEAGAIRAGGRDLRELDLPSWRARLAVVAQRTQLFPISVLGNLGLGAPALGEAQARAAARAADADGFIERLPQRYETVLGEQVRLSGGQIRRLGIARALAKEGADVGLFDEPLSSLDEVRADAIARRLLAWSAGRTVLWATHRLEEARLADRILVLDEGRLAEAGTHEELLRAGGVYAALWQASEGGRRGAAETPRKETLRKEATG